MTDEKRQIERRKRIVRKQGWATVDTRQNTTEDMVAHTSNGDEQCYILSTDIAYLCVIDAKHFLNDPHSDKNAIMSSVLIP